MSVSGDPHVQKSSWVSAIAERNIETSIIIPSTLHAASMHGWMLCNVSKYSFIMMCLCGVELPGAML